MAPMSQTETRTEMTLETARFVTSAPAAALLATLTPAHLTDDALLATLDALRAQAGADEAAALVTQARLRLRAREKFPDADRLFFTADALEQATHAQPAAYRAGQIAAQAPPGPVLDLGCGIGGDALALARHRPVIAFERDPARAHLARANVAALGLADRIEVRGDDWTAALAAGHLPTAAAAFIDPARRRGGRRLMRLADLEPGPVWFARVAAHVPVVAVKVMPGIDDAEIPATCGVEFVGHAGQCKEAVLWFGDAPGTRRAAIHVDGTWHTLSASGAHPPVGPLAAGMTLHEPHPAAIRAGAFAELGALLSAHLFDPQIAYLVSSTRATHPLVQSFVIDWVAPFSLKQLNRHLRAEEIGRVELKKRGFPLEPEQLRARLTLAPGGAAAVVFFTRQGDQRLMLVGRRLQPAAEKVTSEEVERV